MPAARGRCSRLGLVPLTLFSSLGTWGFSPSKSSVGRQIERLVRAGPRARVGHAAAAAAVEPGRDHPRGTRGACPPGEACEVGRHRGGGCGSSSGHQRALRRLTQHVDPHMGAHGELGEGGGRLLPGVRCCGVGRGGREEGRVRARTPPLATAGERAPAPCPPLRPREPGEPRSREPGVGSRPGAGGTHWRHSRRTPSSADTSSADCGWAWLGTRRGLSCVLRDHAPPPLALRTATCPGQRPSRLPYPWTWLAVVPPAAREAPLVPALKKL